MKNRTLKLTLETRLNAILVVDKKTKLVFMSTDMNMSVLEWMIKMGNEKQFPVGYKAPNLLKMKLKYAHDGSSDTHKMSAYLYDDSDYRVFVNIIQEDLVMSN
jgi:hypothetical protein